MQAPPLPGHQLGGDDVAHEAVPQPVALDVRVDDHHRGLRRLAQRREQLVLVRGAHHLGEQAVGHRLLTDRQRRHDALGHRAETGEAAEHQAAQPGGEAVGGALGDGGEGLGDDERVAARAAPDEAREVGVAPVVADDRRDGLVGQRRELEEADGPVAGELGEHPAQRVGDVEGVGAGGDDHQDAFVGEVGDERHHELAGGAVGPVQVVDHEEHGRAGGEPDEDPADQLEQLPARGWRRRPAVEEGPQLLAPRLEGGARGEHPVRRVVGGPGETSQTRGDGPERQLLADVDGGAGDDDPAVVLGARREAPHQLGLAGARVAGEHDGEGAAGASPVPGAGQRGGVGRAPRVGGRSRRRPGAAGNTPLTWHDDRR